MDSSDFAFFLLMRDRPARRTRIRATMQSAERNKQENAAEAASEPFDNKENNGSSSVAQRLLSARGLRLLGRARGARDAPLQQREERSDDTHATRLDQLATLAAAQPPALEVDASILRRRARAARRTAARGDKVVPVDVSFAGALDAYAPREKASQAGGLWRAGWRTDSTKVVFFETNDQLKDMIKRLDTDGLNLSATVANEIGEIFFENRKVLAPVVHGKKICNPARDAALTKASLHRLVEKVLNYVQYHPKRKGAEPAHGAAMWKLWKVLEKAGVTLSGCVEGKLAPFGVEGTFHYGHDGGENHVLSEASSAVCKCWMVAAARGKLDEKVAQCIGCTFGDGTAEAHEVDGLSDAAAGNFQGAARDVAPLRRAYADPQRARVAYVDLLDNGPLPKGTKIVVGMLGAAVMGDAVRRGVVDTTVIIADVGGVNFATVRPDFCTTSTKAGPRLAEDWDEINKLFAERHPAIHKIHGLLAAHGLRDALAGGKPTRKRSAYDVVAGTFNNINALPNGTSPLIKTMRVALFREKVFFGHPATLEAFHAYDPAWPITTRLEAEIGCKVSELTAAAFDADDLVTIDDGGRPWESRTVPKKRTKENERGERVLKKRRDEGKKPATCTACGNKFRSASGKTSGFTCVRGTKSGCGKSAWTKFD